MSNPEIPKNKQAEGQPLPKKPNVVDFGFPKEASSETTERWAKGCVDMRLVGKAIGESGNIVESGRVALSRGFCGPLFVIQTSAGPVVEKTFIVGHRNTDRDAELGLRINVDALEENTPQIKPRLIVLDTKTKERKQVIDWVYNEETALTDLAGIPGIPPYITSVYDGTKGSVVEGYIDGYELSSIWERTKTADEINNIFDRLREVYGAAAEREYLYNNVTGSTILVERTSGQPYLIDWYNHGFGDVKNEKIPPTNGLRGDSKRSNATEKKCSRVLRASIKTKRETGSWLKKKPRPRYAMSAIGASVSTQFFRETGRVPVDRSREEYPSPPPRPAPSGSPVQNEQ